MVFRIGDKKLTGLDKNVWTQKTKAGGADLCTSGHKKNIYLFINYVY